jgi:restriction system protein
MSRRPGGTDDSGCGLLILAALVVGGLSYVAEYITWYGVGVILLALAALTLWLVVRRTSLSTSKAQDLMAGFQHVHVMSGGQFEVYIAQVLRGLGYRTTVLGGSGDQGVDIIATGTNGRIAVQCKNYSKAVGNRPIQEVYAGAKHHRCSQAWVVAPKGYTKGAHELAKSVGVMLFDSDSIQKWIKAVDDAEREAQNQKMKPTERGTSDQKEPEGFKPLEL